MDKFLFYIRMFCGSFLIFFSGIMTLPIYIGIETNDPKSMIVAIFLCIFSLAMGHWWIKRAFDKKHKNGSC